MYKIIKALAVTLTLIVSVNAGATIVVDYVDIHRHAGDYLLLSAGQSYTITHDLTDNGVPTAFQVDSAWLSIGLADDNYIFWNGDSNNQLEFALITAAGVNSGNFEVDGNIFTYDYQFLSVGSSGIAALNNLGTLALTVTSLSLIHI